MSDTQYTQYTNGKGKFPMEVKVKWSAAWATLAPLLVTFITGALTSGDLVTGMPDWLTAVILAAISGGGTAASGYAAPHQNRASTPG